MSDKLLEALIKWFQFAFEPAKRGDSIKPGVERSGTPGSLKERKRAHEVGDSDSNVTKS